MQTALNLTIPDHEHLGNHIKCNITTGDFFSSVWNYGKITFGKCPCCEKMVESKVVKEILIQEKHNKEFFI